MSQMPPPVSPGHPGLAMRPHRGVLILVLGILSWVLGCFIFGIVAWVMGNGDLRAMDAGQMDPEGRGMTQAGKIVGMIHVIVSIVVTVAFLLLLVLGVVGAGIAGAAGGGGGAGP